MKAIIWVSLVIALLGLLAYTNPSMDDYDRFVHQAILKETHPEQSNQPLQMLAPLLSGLVSSYVTSQTLRSDYVFFSLYEARLGDKRLKAFGLLKNFIVLESPEEK